MEDTKVDIGATSERADMEEEPNSELKTLKENSEIRQKDHSDISFNSSFFNNSIDSKNSFLKNELQEVLQKNLGKGNFL